MNDCQILFYADYFMLRDLGKFRSQTFDNFTENGLNLNSMKQFLFEEEIGNFKKYNQDVKSPIRCPYLRRVLGLSGVRILSKLSHLFIFHFFSEFYFGFERRLII
jgi:hypothetical protein